MMTDDFLNSMKALDTPIESANPHKQINLDITRSAAARSGDAAICKELGIHLCPDCGGSGRYRGVRVHQLKSGCFPCKGRGYFMRSYGDRMAERAKAAAKKAAATDRIRSELNAVTPGLVEWIAENSGWCNIAASVNEMLAKGKQPSERQIEVLTSIRIKTETTRQEKAAAREAAKAASYVAIDLAPIRQMFETATSKGAKNPTYRAEGVVISLAKASSVNAGMLYIKSADGVYGGKLDGITFKPVQDGKAHDFARVEAKDGTVILRTAAAALEAIAIDPLAAAIRHGRATGFCSCCGRLLVNDTIKDTDGLTSVQRGIGPVCGRKMGLIP